MFIRGRDGRERGIPGGHDLRGEEGREGGGGVGWSGEVAFAGWDEGWKRRQVRSEGFQ